MKVQEDAIAEGLAGPAIQVRFDRGEPLDQRLLPGFGPVLAGFFRDEKLKIFSEVGQCTLVVCRFVPNMECLAVKPSPRRDGSAMLFAGVRNGLAQSIQDQHVI